MKKHVVSVLTAGSLLLVPSLLLAQTTSSESSSSSSVSSAESSISSSLSSTSSVASSSSSRSSVKTGPCSALEGRYFAACQRKMHTASRAQRLLSRMKSFTDKVMEKIKGLDVDARRNLRREVEATLKACENTRGEERVLCLKKEKKDRDDSDEGKACPADMKRCADGSFVSRDPEHDCRFKECKGDAMRACTEDAKVCPDGTSVGRDPYKNCEFRECPKSSCPKAYAECPPPPSCAAPPQGCHYEEPVYCPSSVAPRGCLLSCGKIECEKSSSSRSSSSKSACRVDGCGMYCVPADQPAMGMPCMLKDEERAVCYRKAVCEKQSNGTCGWTMTQEVRECVSKQQ